MERGTLLGNTVPSTGSGTEDWLLRMVVMLFKVRDMGDQVPSTGSGTGGSAVEDGGDAF